MRTSPFIIAAILKISAEALQVAERAPPAPPLPWRGDLSPLIILANDLSVQMGRPNEPTWLLAFSPPKELSPTIKFSLGDFVLRDEGVVTILAEAEKVVVESVADADAIL